MRFGCGTSRNTESPVAAVGSTWRYRKLWLVARTGLWSTWCSLCRNRSRRAHLLGVTSPNTDQLRARATALRSQARNLDNAKLLSLHLRAGQDVWIGPTATAFLSDLSTAAHHVRTAAQDLRDAARTLEQQAITIDSAGLVGNRTGGSF
jgi:uncharacterized protein YukE